MKVKIKIIPSKDEYLEDIADELYRFWKRPKGQYRNLVNYYTTDGKMVFEYIDLRYVNTLTKLFLALSEIDNISKIHLNFDGVRLERFFPVIEKDKKLFLSKGEFIGKDFNPKGTSYTITYCENLLPLWIFFVPYIMTNKDVLLEESVEEILELFNDNIEKVVKSSYQKSLTREILTCYLSNIKSIEVLRKELSNILLRKSGHWRFYKKYSPPMIENNNTKIQTLNIGFEFEFFVNSFDKNIFDDYEIIPEYYSGQGMFEKNTFLYSVQNPTLKKLKEVLVKFREELLELIEELNINKEGETGYLMSCGSFVFIGTHIHVSFDDYDFQRLGGGSFIDKKEVLESIAWGAFLEKIKHNPSLRLTSHHLTGKERKSGYSFKGAEKFFPVIVPEQLNTLEFRLFDNEDVLNKENHNFVISVLWKTLKHLKKVKYEPIALPLPDVSEKDVVLFHKLSNLPCEVDSSWEGVLIELDRRGVIEDSFNLPNELYYNKECQCVE